MIKKIINAIIKPEIIIIRIRIREEIINNGNKINPISILHNNRMSLHSSKKKEKNMLVTQRIIKERNQHKNLLRKLKNEIVFKLFIVHIQKIQFCFI